MKKNINQVFSVLLQGWKQQKGEKVSSVCVHIHRHTYYPVREDGERQVKYQDSSALNYGRTTEYFTSFFAKRNGSEI